MAAKKLKASERSTLIGTLMTPLKKRYGAKPPESSRPVLETLLFAALLENNTDEHAESALVSLLDAFHDLNEIRVSSIREIEVPIGDLPEADWRSLRIKDALQHVFELNYDYDLDGLKKKNQETATAELKEVPRITPFMRNYSLQVGIGNHVMPVDRHQLALLRYLGLVELTAGEDTAADELKSAVRKADGPLLSFLLRQAANEPAVLAETESYAPIENDPDRGHETPGLPPSDALDVDEPIDAKSRIKELGRLLDGKATGKTPKTAAKKTVKKAAAKKTVKKSTKKVVKKVAKKATVEK